MIAHLRWGTFAASLLCLCATTASAAVIDLSSAPIGAANAGPGGAIFTVNNAQSAGTGTINSFLRLHGTGNANTQMGYNVGFPANNFPPGFPDYQQVGGNFTYRIQLGAIPNVGGPAGYRRFLLDINEPGGNTDQIDLTRLQVFVGNINPNALAGPLAGELVDPSPSFGDRVYDLDIGEDNTLILADRFAGSGSMDLVIDIPENLFVGHGSTEFLTLFADFNRFEGGFEEFAVRGPGGGPGGGGGGTGDPVPEPMSLLVFGLLAGLGVTSARLRRRKAAAE